MTPEESLVARLRAMERALRVYHEEDAFSLTNIDNICAEVSEAADLIESMRAEIEKLRIYLNAAATDYEGMCETIKRDGRDLLSKSVIEMAESATMLRRATGGEDVWSAYEAELVTQKRYWSAREESLRAECLEAIAPFAKTAADHDEAGSFAGALADPSLGLCLVSSRGGLRHDFAVGDLHKLAALAAKLKEE